MQTTGDNTYLVSIYRYKAMSTALLKQVFKTDISNVKHLPKDRKRAVFYIT